MSGTRTRPCPPTCTCICHDTQGGATAQHGDHPRCPTKDGLPLVQVEWEHA